jgi:hypothetical protein
MNAASCAVCGAQLESAWVRCPSCGHQDETWAPDADPWAGATSTDESDSVFNPWTIPPDATGVPRAGSARPTEWIGRTPVQIAHVIVKRGTPQGQAFPLGELSAVGRDSRANDVVLRNDDSVSRQHAQIRLEDGSFVFYNLSASYGSYLLTAQGRRRIEGRIVLCDGDELEIGERTVIAFRQSS